MIWLVEISRIAWQRKYLRRWWRWRCPWGDLLGRFLESECPKPIKEMEFGIINSHLQDVLGWLTNQQNGTLLLVKWTFFFDFNSCSFFRFIMQPLNQISGFAGDTGDDFPIVSHSKSKKWKMVSFSGSGVFAKNFSPKSRGFISKDSPQSMFVDRNLPVLRLETETDMMSGIKPFKPISNIK